MTLFKLGRIVLHSGEDSNFKIECDALTDEDIETLAWLGAQIAPPFNSVVGVPRGGLRLAAAMRAHMNPDAPTTLVVDDVWTTGDSMDIAMGELPRYGEEQDGQPAIAGLVIFARRPITTNEVQAIFTAHTAIKRS